MKMDHYDTWMLKAGFEIQRSDTRKIRRWSCRFPASFRVVTERRYWLVRAWTKSGAYRKARRRRRKDLKLLSSVNREDWPRHNMKES